ncbi:MAG: hypothetical protein QXP01_08595, partial [Candidatus Hadarchaeum sp.]
YGLTGIGGPWAQDPPYYAEVVAFETGTEMDWAHIRLTGWRGWQHDRWIYFYHNGGPIVIVDEARGPAGAKGGVVWHVVDGEPIAAGHFRIRSGDDSMEMRMISLSDGRLDVLGQVEGTLGRDWIYLGKPDLRLMTVFLRNDSKD